MNRADALQILNTKSTISNPNLCEKANQIAKQSLEVVLKIEDILRKRDYAFDGQEFGATYSDLDNIIEEIREAVFAQNEKGN